MKIALYDNVPQQRKKLKSIDRFGNKNRLTRAILIAMTLKFAEKFHHPFLHVFLFGNMFHESDSFVAMPVASCTKDTCSKIVHL